jgi:ferredoxin
MNALIEKATQLLESGTVKAVLGYAPGTLGARRPLFARTPAQARKLIFDEACVQNLATYLTKAEVRRLGRVALTAGPTALRAILQLMAERQLKEEDLLVLALDATGQITALATAQALEEHVAQLPGGLAPKDRALLDRLDQMTRQERWDFWQKELSRCIKCYACRNSCPMCYCGHCTMDCNRPQWVPAPSHALGNLEYHMVRAMHLGGRCVECGDCGRACPVGIPIHLLTINAEESVHAQFGQRAGASAKLDYALSTFKPDDKETFIR